MDHVEQVADLCIELARAPQSTGMEVRFTVVDDNEITQDHIKFHELARRRFAAFVITHSRVSLQYANKSKMGCSKSHMYKILPVVTYRNLSCKLPGEVPVGNHCRILYMYDFEHSILDLFA